MQGQDVRQMPSAEQLNGYIGRTSTPPDLHTIVDEHLRNVYTNVYSHPISLNTKSPRWADVELGYIMVQPESFMIRDSAMIPSFPTMVQIGTIHVDRVLLFNTKGDATFCSADPSFLQKFTDYLDNAAYVSKFIRRNQNVA